MLLSRDAVNTTSALHASIDADIAAAEALRKALTFGGILDGDYYAGSLNTGAGHFALEFANVCTVKGMLAAAPDCETFANGLARNGRQALIAEEVRLIPLFISQMDADIISRSQISQNRL